VLSALDADRPVAVRQGNLIATSFHPELTNDYRFHSYFLELADANGNSATPQINSTGNDAG
jgi:5'-phosphate synthase pdxT subunit